MLGGLVGGLHCPEPVSVFVPLYPENVPSQNDPKPTCTKCCVGQGKTAPVTHWEQQPPPQRQGQTQQQQQKQLRSGRISSKSGNSNSRSSGCRSTSNRNSNSNRNGSTSNKDGDSERGEQRQRASEGLEIISKGTSADCGNCKAQSASTLSIDEGMECSALALFPPYAQASHFKQQNPMCCASSCSSGNV